MPNTKFITQQKLLTTLPKLPTTQPLLLKRQDKQTLGKTLSNKQYQSLQDPVHQLSQDSIPVIKLTGAS